MPVREGSTVLEAGCWQLKAMPTHLWSEKAPAHDFTQRSILRQSQLRYAHGVLFSHPQVPEAELFGTAFQPRYHRHFRHCKSPRRRQARHECRPFFLCWDAIFMHKVPEGISQLADILARRLHGDTGDGWEGARCGAKLLCRDARGAAGQRHCTTWSFACRHGARAVARGGGIRGCPASVRSKQKGECARRVWDLNCRSDCQVITHSTAVQLAQHLLQDSAQSMELKGWAVH